MLRELTAAERRAFKFAVIGPPRKIMPPWADPSEQDDADAAWEATYATVLEHHLAKTPLSPQNAEFLAYHLERELRDSPENAAAFACVLSFKDADGAARKAVMDRLEDPHRAEIDALVDRTVAAEPPPTPGDKRALDHFAKTGEFVPPELLPDPPAAEEPDDPKTEPPPPGSRGTTPKDRRRPPAESPPKAALLS